MLEQFSRTAMQLGWDNIKRLQACRVAIFGIGGVGGYCVEALARAGIGGIDMFDHDQICLTNLNRQIIATRKTVGQYKVDAMRERILEINPNAKVNAYKLFYSPETAPEIDLSVYDYIVDAVDTMTAKLEIVCRAAALGIPVISSMGTANKLDPTAFEIADIYKTSICPMARIMRRELRKRDIKSLKVVYSKEAALTPSGEAVFDDQTGCGSTQEIEENQSHRRQTPSSNSFVPPVAGFIIAGEVIRDLIRGEA